MAPILRRLQTCGVDFPAFVDDSTGTWTFTTFIGEKDQSFFRQLVQNHDVLSFEYSVHCAKLAHDLSRKDNGEELTLQIEAALIMSELLGHIYRYYLGMPQEVMRLKREQDIYRHFLSCQGYQFDLETEKNDDVSASMTNSIRCTTAEANWPRLFTLRIRRLLLAIAMWAESFEQFRRLVSTIDRFVSPVLAYVAWVFFTPRLVSNLLLMTKHVLPGSWMKEEEKELGWQIRWQIQMRARWFELGNDSAWLTAGLLNCFVLTGIFTPMSIQLAVGLQAFDVVMACARCYIEIGRLQTLQADYKKMLTDPSTTEDIREDIPNYLQHLQKRLSCDQQRLQLAIINASLLLLSISMALPVFAVYPMIPLIGAVLSVLITVGCYKGIEWVEKKRPIDKISKEQIEEHASVVTYSMFRPLPSPKPRSNSTPFMRTSPSTGAIIDQDPDVLQDAPRLL